MYINYAKQRHRLFLFPLPLRPVKRNRMKYENDTLQEKMPVPQGAVGFCDSHVSA